MKTSHIMCATKILTHLRLTKQGIKIKIRLWKVFTVF